MKGKLAFGNQVRLSKMGRTCRRPSPRLGSPRVFSSTEQGAYGVDRAMSYMLPPWIRPPLEDSEPPSMSSYPEPSSSLGPVEDDTAGSHGHESTDETADETHMQPGIAIAGELSCITKVRLEFRGMIAFLQCKFVEMGHTSSMVA